MRARAFHVPRRARFVVATAVAFGSALSSRDARAEDATPAASVDAPRTVLLTPDARRFLAPSPFGHWAGTERTLAGELSLAPPRPLESGSLLPARDDHRGTSTYVTYDHAAPTRRTAWNLLELTSLHDVRGGSVLGLTFRADARDRTAIQGIATLVVPVSPALFLVPTLTAGARSEVAPSIGAGFEVRTDRRGPRGFAFGADVSRWTYDRTRAMGNVGYVARLTDVIALEERVAVGAWAGPRLGGDLALQWSTSALEDIGHRMALYQRVTLARGAALPLVAATPVDHSATSVDVTVGARRALGRDYGVVIAVDEGGQSGTYARWGVDLTLYGNLF